MTAKAAFGTKLYRETSPGSGTFTELTGIRDITGPDVSAETQDTTTMASSGGFREKTATVSMLGDVTATLFYDSTDATQNTGSGLAADCVSRTIRLYRIVYTDSGAEVCAFNGYVTRFTMPEANHDGILTSQVTITPTGAPTFS